MIAYFDKKTGLALLWKILKYKLLGAIICAYKNVPISRGLKYFLEGGMK